MAGTRKLRKELTYEYGKLLGMQEGIDPASDSPEQRAKYAAIRDQADRCVALLDQYQSSVPKRMASYAENECATMRQHLAATGILFNAASGEWEEPPSQ